MAINRGTDDMREVLALVEVRTLRATDDQGLLQRFVEANDEAAFRVIAERHGPMVLGVCRRVLSCPYDAEDALQATFLVFARKAASVRSVASLAGWLHGVATRVATTLRRERHRRRSREQAATPPTVVEPRDELSWAEVKCGLDEELARLPVGYREVLVLCCLEGQTRDEAAQQLGVAVGVVKGRLERARKALADRLAKRGLTLSAGLFAIAVSSQVAAVSVRVSALVSNSPAVSPDVLTLANSVLEGMTMSQLRLSVTGLLAVAALVTGMALGLAQPASAKKVEPPVREPIKAPVPKEKPDAGLIWTHNTKTNALVAYTPDGKEAKKVTLPEGMPFLGFTPDGQKMTFAGKKGKASNDVDGRTLHVGDISDKCEGTDTGLEWKRDDYFRWSPDGTRVVRVRFGPMDKAGGLTYEHQLYDVATKKGQDVKLPVNHYLTGWSADGKMWLLHEYVRADLRDPKLPRYRMMTVPTGGGKQPTPLCDGASLTQLEPAADGKSFHGVGHGHKVPADDTEDATYCRWFRVGDTGGVTLVKKFDDFVSIELRTSPDRDRIACMGRTAHDDSGDTALLLYDPDGGNEQKLLTLKKDGQSTRLLGWFPAKPAPAKKDDPTAKSSERELIKAPVPKEKEETMGLKASVTPEKKEFMLGEPTYFAFTVENPTDKGWGFDVGGDHRNRLGRPDSFEVTVRGADGKTVPQPDSGGNMGGLSWAVKLPTDGTHTFTLFLPHWATFDKPGEYILTVRRKLSLVPLDLSDDERRKVKPEVASVSASAKIVVTKPDAKKFGDLIDTLGVELLNPQRAERATKMLLLIQDERVIPHFVKLSQLPRVEPRYAACEGLKKFKTDEAFAALKAMTATTGDDLKGSAVNRQLEVSSARAVRHVAVSALADCPHPDALPLVWKAVDDENDSVRLTVLHKAFEVKSAEARKIIEKLIEDTDERVRNEAKRYAGLLAKEKK